MSRSRKKANIRPASRHIFAIGKDLIQNQQAAIIELVKNSFDADSNQVIITFDKLNENSIKIIIQDFGHGMSNDTVLKKWMVPSTDDKLRRKYSPEGRLMQGRKGIGRYAVSILGNTLDLKTIDTNGEKTSLYINWMDFKNSELNNTLYLDQIDIDLYVEQSNEKSGTILEIIGNEDHLEEWSEKNLDHLIKELTKLVSPLDTDSDDVFNIEIIFNNFSYKKYNENKIKISPYKILDLYDYQLKGTIEKMKIENINQENFIEKNKLNNLIKKVMQQKNKNDHKLIIAKYEYINTLSQEQESFNDVIEIENGKYCGKVQFDLRVFDREPEAILELIKRGLKDSITNQFIGINEAKRLLNEMCGVSIYRGKFRVRPYGDPGYDWLKLDARRVQEPSKRIGNNQIIGSVTIEAEEESNLEEKSARDGLRENNYYSGLIEVITESLPQFEERRFDFRKKTGRGRKSLLIETTLEDVFKYDELKEKIESKLEREKIEKNKVDNIVHLIDETEKKKKLLLEDIKETIAKYEGHVTLGKIIMVIMHEADRPLAYFKNQIPLLSENINSLTNNYSDLLLKNTTSILNDILEQTEFFIELFNRLQHLAVKKRKRKQFKILRVLKQTINVFINELTRNNIKLNYECDENLELFGWKEDFYMTFANLIENSIYWLIKSYKTEKYININIVKEDERLTIDYMDNGIGIEKKYIEENKIFEPGFSTKKGGTGLGLAITGEALARNNGSIEAIYSEQGANFRIEINLGEEIDE